MNRFTHIVFGDSARGVLKYFLSGKQTEFAGDVIGIRDDYSIGSIYAIDQEEGLETRIEWIIGILKKLSLYEEFVAIDKDLKKIAQQIRDIESDAKVIIWHGKNTNDQIGLRYILSQLKSKEVYEVNVSDIYLTSKYVGRYKPRTLSECSPETINVLLPLIKKIEATRYNSLVHEWEELRQTKENLRILQDNKIIGVDETYYDAAILANCTCEFQKTAKVVGATMGKSDQLIGDTYLDYRVRYLIDINRVEYKGKLVHLRDFEIRLK